jgi:hypothetical protein
MRYILILLFYFGLTVSNANAATVSFYNNDLAGFNLASTTLLTDFEGRVSDSGTESAKTITIDGNEYSNLANSSDLAMLICGKIVCDGQPFDSALMLANFANGAMWIDLKDNITAVGGLFGDLNGPAGSETLKGTLRVYDSGGLVASESVIYGDMGAGEAKTFFGWTTTETVFTALEFAIDPQSNLGRFSAVDNFQYGSANSLPQVPIPAAVWLFGTALIGLVGFGKRKARAAA